MVDKYCRIALEHMDIPLLGCIPHECKLTQPNLEQVVAETNGRWLNGKNTGSNIRIAKVIIGAIFSEKSDFSKMSVSLARELNFGEGRGTQIRPTRIKKVANKSMHFC